MFFFPLMTYKYFVIIIFVAFSALYCPNGANFPIVGLIKSFYSILFIWLHKVVGEQTSTTTLCCSSKTWRRPVLPETSIRTINSQPSMMWPWQLCCQTILVVSCHITEVKSEVPADYAASGACWSQTGLCVGSNYLHLQMMSGWKMRPVSGRRTAGGCLCHENTELHVSGIKGGKKEKTPWQRETCGLILLNCLLLFTRTVRLK